MSNFVLLPFFLILLSAKLAFHGIYNMTDGVHFCWDFCFCNMQDEEWPSEAVRPSVCSVQAMVTGRAVVAHKPCAETFQMASSCLNL